MAGVLGSSLLPSCGCQQSPAKDAARSLTTHTTPAEQQRWRSFSSSHNFGKSQLARPSAGAKRHAARKAEHDAQIQCQAGDKMTVSITGATGLVGSRLVSRLAAQGHTVRVLTRDVNKARSKLPYGRLEFYGPADWGRAIEGATSVVNLAGEPIATRWTAAHKVEIKRSRVGTTQRIVEAINALPADQRPSVLVSTSAIGYYGTSDSTTFSESSRSGSDYLSEVCREWEAVADSAQVGRKVIVRFGIVLAREGGALARMLPVFNVFAGGPLGSGRQWFSWIHRDDLVNMLIEALQNPGYSGVYNGCAPNPVRMSELCSSLGTVLGRPSWLPVPDFALQTLLGEGAGVVLDGQRVLPVRAQEAGFRFQYPEVTAALRNVAS